MKIVLLIIGIAIGAIAWDLIVEAIRGEQITQSDVTKATDNATRLAFWHYRIHDAEIELRTLRDDPASTPQMVREGETKVANLYSDFAEQNRKWAEGDQSPSH